MPSYQEFAITIYQTKEDIETSWKSTHNIIKEYATSELQSIEDIASYIPVMVGAYLYDQINMVDSQVF